MTVINHHRFRTAGALTLAAIAAGPSLAAAATHATDPRSPDARDAAAQAQRPAVSRSDPRSPDARDAALAAVGRGPTRSPVVVSVTRSRGFAWGDAAIGAGGSAGVLLVAAGAAGLATRRRHERYPRPARTTADIGSR
jgi:hypothetical protein